MGLFSNPEKEEQKYKELIEKYNLDTIPQSDYALLKEILYHMAQTSNWAKSSLSINSETRAQFSAQQAIVSQNFMIIKQLDRLNKNIEKLLNK